jgi:hypothetical protein
MVFDQDAHEAFDRPKHGTVQHHGNMLVAVFTDVGGTEAFGHIEIDLQRTALPVAADGIAQDELQLRAVERAFARVVRVLEATRLERLQERLLGLVPDLSNPKSL